MIAETYFFQNVKMRWHFICIWRTGGARMCGLIQIGVGGADL